MSPLRPMNVVNEHRLTTRNDLVREGLQCVVVTCDGERFEQAHPEFRGMAQYQSANPDQTTDYLAFGRVSAVAVVSKIIGPFVVLLTPEQASQDVLNLRPRRVSSFRSSADCSASIEASSAVIRRARGDMCGP